MAKGKISALLKVVSILFIISGVCTLLLGVFGGILGALATTDDSSASYTPYLMALAVIGIGGGALQLILGIFGVTGRFKPATVLVWVVLMFGVIGIISSIMNMGSGGTVQQAVSSSFSLVLPILFLVGIRQSEKRGADAHDSTD